MTSSKWITCCHRRSIQSDQSQSNALFCTINVKNSTPNGKAPPIPYKCHHQDVLRPSSTSNNSALIQSSSPTVSPSVFDIGRKSSSISSSSSSAASSSSTVYNEHRASFMKHSSSSYDLSSPHRFAQNFRQQLSNHRPHDDSIINFMSHSAPITVQNTITLINPLECFLINCETNDDTKCAQISPEMDVIAVANDYWLAFYSIRTNNCVGMLQFPDKCVFWTWIRAETIAVITENEVFHWRLTNVDTDTNYIQKTDSPRFIFSLDEMIKNNQIIDYSIDPVFGNWCALTSLFVDDNGEIGGIVQIFSHSYMRSQSIEAHSCTFVSYKFDDSSQSSILLVAAKKENNQMWKLHIIELGPIPDGNQNHRHKTQQLMLHTMHLKSAPSDPNFFDDIPTNIVCDNRIGLIFILSKYGIFYICDIETGTPLFCENVLPGHVNRTAFFSLTFDKDTNSLIALARSGQVLLIKISISDLIEESPNIKVQSKVFERISKKMLEIKKINVKPNHNHVRNTERNLAIGQPSNSTNHEQVVLSDNVKSKPGSHNRKTNFSVDVSVGNRHQRRYPNECHVEKATNDMITFEEEITRL